MADKKAFYQSQARVIKALAHPTRLLLVNALSARPVCVCELTEAAGCDISTVSLHLNVMRAAGLVQSQKKANKVFYSLCCPCILDFLGCVTRVVKTSARNQSAALSGGRRSCV